MRTKLREKYKVQAMDFGIFTASRDETVCMRRWFLCSLDVMQFYDDSFSPTNVTRTQQNDDPKANFNNSTQVFYVGKTNVSYMCRQ